MARLIIFILLLIFLQDIACNNLSHAGENRAIANKDHQHGFVNWSFRNGIYNVQAGQLFVRSDESNPIATINKQEKGDVVFSATLVSNKEPHWAGILAKEGYKLIVNNQSGRLELSKRIDGKWKQLAHKDKYKLYARNTNKFELTICFIGNKILGIIDNSLLIEYEDILPIDKHGNYALISGWHSNIVWSDVSLSKDFKAIPIMQSVTKVFTDNKFINVTWSRNIRDDGIYFDNEVAGLTFKIKSNNGVVNNAALRFDLLDTKGNLVEQKEINLDTLTSKEVKLSVKFSPPRRGSFKVAFYAGHKSEKHVWIEDIGSFTVLPKIPGKTISNSSYFGGHIDGINAGWHLLAAKKLGIKWLRSHDGVQTAWWTRIQPEGPSSWLWPYDDVQQLADSMNFQTLGNFLWTPLWASSAAIGNSNPRTAPPKNMDYFSLFVNKVTKHYKKSINHWEVWNEPHYQGYWQGSPEDYTTLLKTAYIAIHNADKESFVLGGGGVLPNKSDWLEKMLIAGGGKYMDGFSIHYLNPDTATRDMNKLKNLLSTYGFSGPIWNTEASVPSTSFFSQLKTDQLNLESKIHYRNACYELVRMYMENIANGVQRIFYYNLFDPWRFKEYSKPRDDINKINHGMWDENRMLKPIAAAHAAMVYALQGRKYSTRIDHIDFHVFIFEDSDGATAVQYAEFPSYQTEETISLKPTIRASLSDFKILDYMGNETIHDKTTGDIQLTISREPRYILLSGQGAGDVLKNIYTEAFLQHHNNE